MNPAKSNYCTKAQKYACCFEINPSLGYFYSAQSKSLKLSLCEKKNVYISPKWELSKIFYPFK